MKSQNASEIGLNYFHLSIVFPSIKFAILSRADTVKKVNFVLIRQPFLLFVLILFLYFSYALKKKKTV